MARAAPGEPPPLRPRHAERPARPASSDLPGHLGPLWSARAVAALERATAPRKACCSAARRVVCCACGAGWGLNMALRMLLAWQEWMRAGALSERPDGSDGETQAVQRRAYADLRWSPDRARPATPLGIRRCGFSQRCPHASNTRRPRMASWSARRSSGSFRSRPSSSQARLRR